MPPVGEGAVLDTPLPPRPVLEPLSPEEKKSVPRTVKGKIIRYGNNCNAVYDAAEAIIKAHQEYERKLFSGQQKKK